MMTHLRDRTSSKFHKSTFFALFYEIEQKIQNFINTFFHIFFAIPFRIAINAKIYLGSDLDQIRILKFDCGIENAQRSKLPVMI